MNDWRDEDPEPARKPASYYRNSASMCGCDNCNAGPTEEP